MKRPLALWSVTRQPEHRVHRQWAGPGILYGRTPIGTFTAQLWFAPFGGNSNDTGLRATAWDWSATPPSGIG